MLSQAGRQYERSKRVKPLEKMQRERVYKSSSVKVSKVIANKKFSPFNTVSRENRDSYLLRVTNQPNTSTNYNPKFDLTMPLDRRSTIDNAKFQRIIGDVKDQDYSVELSSFAPKCLKSHTSTENRPLTVRQTHDWRKTYEHFDFSKQQDSKRLDLPQKYTAEQSTKQDFMQTLQSVTQSNFNNYRRFSFQPRLHKAHQFDSDSGHKYLLEVENRQKSPEYDIAAANQSFVKKAMPKTKGEKRFYLYKQQIVTRFDRNDHHWNTFLEYDSKNKNKIKNTINFNQTLDRQENDIHSKYPIRLSLTRPIRIKD